MVDPYREQLAGMDRIMFDATIAASTVTAGRLAAGDTDGISVRDRVEFERRGLDLGQSNELERMKRNLKRQGVK